MDHPFLNQKHANPLTHLNVGCGKVTRSTWLNLDKTLGEGVDHIADLDQDRLPFVDDRFTHIYCSHTLEHLCYPLHMMQELHRVAKPNAIAYFRVPYGSSDAAFEDPTHQRQYFLQSFGYFSQAAYGGADYGYKGDWALISRLLVMKDHISQNEWGNKLEELLQMINSARNLVDEMHVTLRAQKPTRAPGTFVEQSPINFRFTAA